MMAEVFTNQITIMHWLVLTAVLFAIGLYGLLTRRNAIGVLMAVELMLNATAINFVVFNRMVSPGRVDGEIMAIFIIAVAAAEALIAMAIFVALFKSCKTADVTQINVMKG